jgi:hypothetical protein
MPAFLDLLHVAHGRDFRWYLSLFMAWSAAAGELDETTRIHWSCRGRGGRMAASGNKVHRVGVLFVGSGQGSVPDEAFRSGLRERGYIEAQNIVVEFQSARGIVRNLIHNVVSDSG